MRAVIQRVSKARVSVDDEVVGSIDAGLLILLGINHEDGLPEISYLAEKISHLRIFDDEQGRMNLSLRDVKGEALVVSQFTLYGDCRKGRRPSYGQAAPPEKAREIYDLFCRKLARYVPVATGRFQAMMEVSLVNDGPVTLVLERDAAQK